MKLDYLKVGTPRQRAAFEAIHSLNLFSLLAGFDPILTGTIPIDIDLPNSDLDIICSSKDLNKFKSLVLQEFGHFSGFNIRITEISKIPSVVANFKYNEFEFELFCQETPTKMQNAFIHMIVEERLLRLAGPNAREEIRRLKSTGMKTEPAFAALFNIPGNSYQSLLDLYRLSDDELRKFVKH